MAARNRVLVFVLGVGIFAAGGWAVDDTHGGHGGHGATPAHAPATKTEPAKSVAAKGEASKTPLSPKLDIAAKPKGPSVEAVDGPVSADDALKLLREGNERWLSATAVSPATETERRRTTAEDGQHPFATILTCADSRLPVERIFDRGVGELFVLRVAGNVVGTNEAGTIEYGAAHLNVPLLIVMGHTRCGAVAAASASGHAEGHATPPNIAGLLEHIEPAVARARKANPEATDAEVAAAAVRENVWQSIFDLIRFSDPVRAQLRDGKLTIVGAVCDVADGKVIWLGEHPWQEELVSAFDARREAARAVAEAAESEEPAVAGHGDADH